MRWVSEKKRGAGRPDAPSFARLPNMPRFVSPVKGYFHQRTYLSAEHPFCRHARTCSGHPSGESRATAGPVAPDRCPGRAWTPAQGRGDSGARRQPRPSSPGRPPPSCPDLFRASTSCGIAVRVGRGRGGGPTWMPGTSPGMTGRGQVPENARPTRHCPRPSAHCPRRKSRPDSNGFVNDGYPSAGRMRSSFSSQRSGRPCARAPSRSSMI